MPKDTDKVNNLIEITSKTIKCSETMKEAILYREDTKTKVRDAKKELSHLCLKQNMYSAICIAFAKDAEVKNEIISKACSNPVELTHLCILTAVSKELSNEELISYCSRPSIEKINCIAEKDSKDCILMYGD